MAVTYGFFNSVNGDRKYNADQMSEYFRGIVSQGVFQHLDSGMAVSAGTGLSVSVAAGRAIIQNRWVQNSAALNLTISDASETYGRKDAVVIRLDKSSRAISIAVKTGTPAASPVAPSMTRNETTYEMALAYVNVAAGASSVTVTDKRSDSSVCGWASVAQATSGEVDQMLNAMKTGFDGVEYDSPVEMVQGCDEVLQGEIDDLNEVTEDFIFWNYVYLHKWLRGTIFNTGWDNNNSYARTDPVVIGTNKQKVVCTLADTSFKYKIIYIKQVGGVWTKVTDGSWNVSSGTMTVRTDTSATHYIISLTINTYSGNIWDGDTALVNFNNYITTNVEVTNSDVDSLITRVGTLEAIDESMIGSLNDDTIKNNTLYNTNGINFLARGSLDWKATSTSTWVSASYLNLEIAATQGNVLIVGALYMDSLSSQMIYIFEQDGNGTDLKQTIISKTVLLDSSNKVNPYEYVVQNASTTKVIVRFGMRFNAQSSGYPDVVVGTTYHIRNAYVLNKRAKLYRQDDFLFDLPSNWKDKVETIKINKGKKFSFCVQTDTHLRMRSQYDSLFDSWVTYCRNLSKLSYVVGFDYVCNLGDIIRGYDDATIDTTDNMREAYNTVMDRYLQFIKCPLLITLGNHDDNNMYATAQGDPDLKIPVSEQWARAILPASNTMKSPVFNGRSTYYYQDFEDAGIRVIMLDTCGESMFSISQTQLDWFSSIALDTDHAILIMTHVPLVDGVHPNVDVVGNRDEVMAAIKAFKTNGGTVIGCFYGHTHAQESATIDGILHVCFKDGADIGETVMIDTENKTIDTITLGFSGNRSLSYS